MRSCKVGWVAQQLKRVVQSSQRCDPRMGGRRGGPFVRASNFVSDESLGYQHMGVVYHRERISSASTKVLKQVVERGEEATTSPEGLSSPKSKRWSEWRRGGTSVESSIPCSHGGRALVVKGAEEVENSKANSKY
ncbi:hypothetical protein BHE74_00032896 [Ensete ventricosum]|nr:hypothetical protein BHE74_00032896 [Ensete ventricosum]